MIKATSQSVCSGITGCQVEILGSGAELLGEADTQTLGTLKVTSEAGSEAGTTKLTVKEQLMSMRNCWKYKDAAAATAVTYGMDVKNWSKWDGESEIASTATHHP